MMGAVIMLAGLALQWRRIRGAIGLFLGQAAVSLVALAPLAATTATLSRVRGPCHLSGDDAMGAGIDFLFLSGIAIAFVVGVTIAGLVRGYRFRRLS
jgi:hypothetical protein